MAVLQRSARLAGTPRQGRLRVRAGALEASFRTYKILQREEQEFYWGSSKKQQWGFSGQAHNLQTCSSSSTSTSTATGAASSLQSATSYLELLQAVQANLHQLTGAQLHYAVMRLSVYADQGDRPPEADLVPVGHRLAATIGQLGREQLVTSLWAVACLGLRDSAACEALLLGAADALQEVTSGRQDDDVFDRQDLVTLLWALGSLASAAHGPAPPVQALVAHLCGQLADSGAGHLRELTSPEDRTDLAVGLARLAAACPAGAPARQSAEDVMQKLAGEVQRDLSNKHSGSGAVFTARQLGSFVGAYARLGGCSGTVPRMLDAISNTVVAGIRARHLHCVSRPGDMVRLLAAFRDLRHTSVAVPELLRAFALQLRTELACAHEMASRAPPGQATSNLCEPDVAAELLQCYLDLHHSPGPSLLQALWVDLCRGATPLPPPAAARLLLVTLQLAHHPGGPALTRFLARLPPAASIEPPSLASICCACALLDHPLPAPLLAALQALLNATAKPAGVRQAPDGVAVDQGADALAWDKDDSSASTCTSSSSGSSSGGDSRTSTTVGSISGSTSSTSYSLDTHRRDSDSSTVTSSTSTSRSRSGTAVAAARTNPTTPSPRTPPHAACLLQALRALGCSRQLDPHLLHEGLQLLSRSCAGSLTSGQLAAAAEACWLAGAVGRPGGAMMDTSEGMDSIGGGSKQGSGQGGSSTSQLDGRDTTSVDSSSTTSGSTNTSTSTSTTSERVVEALEAAGFNVTEAEVEQAWAGHLQQLLDSSILPPSATRPFHDAFPPAGWLPSRPPAPLPRCGLPTLHLLTLHPDPTLTAQASHTATLPPPHPHSHPDTQALPSLSAAPAATGPTGPSPAVPTTATGPTGPSPAVPTTATGPTRPSPAVPTTATGPTGPSPAVPSTAVLVVWRQAATSASPPVRVLGAALLLRRLLCAGLAEGQVLVEAQEAELEACRNDAERGALARAALAMARLPVMQESQLPGC